MPLPTVGLTEETPLVRVGARLDDNEPRQGCLDDIHEARRVPADAGRGADRTPSDARLARMSATVADHTVGGSWEPGPARPVLAAHEMHVWFADMRSVTDGLLLALSESERARRARFPRRGSGTLWARSRGTLRALLSLYLDVDPARVLLHTGPAGELSLPGGPSIGFSLSHSGPVAMYAVSVAGPVGVDVQLPRPGIDSVGLTRRFFGAATAERLATLDPYAREREFLRSWARREAEVKCCGNSRGTGQPGTSLWLADLEVGEQAAAAVASHEQPGTLNCWRWPPRPMQPAR